MKSFSCLALLLLGLTGSAFAQSCPFAPSEAVPDTLDPRGYYPLQPGNAWEYKQDFGWFAGWEEYRREEVTGDTTIDGEHYARIAVTRYGLEGEQGLRALSHGVSFVAVDDSGLVYSDGSFRAEPFGTAFNTCVPDAGSGVLLQVGGRYDPPLDFGGIRARSEKIVQGDYIRRHFAHGVGLIQYQELVQGMIDLQYVSIGGLTSGVPLGASFTLLPPLSEDSSLASTDTLSQQYHVVLHNTHRAAVRIDSLAFSRTVTLWRYYGVEFAHQYTYGAVHYVNGTMTDPPEFPAFVLLPNEVKTLWLFIPVATKGGGVSGVPKPGVVADTLFIYGTLSGGGPVRDTVFIHENLIPTGAEEEAAKPRNRVAVYPNPASTSMWIEFENAAPADVDLSIFDLLGRTLMQTRWTVSGVVTNRQSVDVSRLASGAYFVQARICVPGQSCSTSTVPIIISK